MKNQSSGIRLFAAALNYASKIAHGDPEYTLEKANKIFPPEYFARVVKEYSNLTELNRYAKVRRVLLTKASGSYKYAIEDLQVADSQLKHLKEFKDNWQDVISKHKQEMSAEEQALCEKYSTMINNHINGLSVGLSNMKRWFYNIGALENTAIINKEIESVNRLTARIIGGTAGLQAGMMYQLHRILNKETNNE